MKNAYLLFLMFVLFITRTGLRSQEVPVAGDIVITEIMANPGAVSDSNGEWIEIWNSSGHGLLLNGLVLKDAGSNNHVIKSDGNLVLPADHYWILARVSDTMANGGVHVDYTIQNFTLGNSSDQVIICLPDGTVIDEVFYSDGWPLVSGASMELDPRSLAAGSNNDPLSWFTAVVPYGAGDKGSPGRANQITSGMEAPSGEIRMVIYPNPSEGRFMLEAELPVILPGEIRMINLIGQDFIYRRFSERKILREVIEPAFLTPGIWFMEIIAGDYSRISRFIVE